MTNTRSPVFYSTISDLARRALLEELELFPKPGLVSIVDSGAHRDMDYELLKKSAEAVAPFFADLAAAGAGGGGFFHDLVPIGMAAEERMLKATGGINTHRGAIFALGLLSASAGACQHPEDPRQLRATMMEKWGRELLIHAQNGSKLPSHRGARNEAAKGFPGIFDCALPCLERRISQGFSRREAAVEALFFLLERLDDSNLLQRGGEAGQNFAREVAEDFLKKGSIDNPEWEKAAIAAHRAFVLKGLSPGGCADLLAGSLFVGSLSKEPTRAGASKTPAFVR